MAEEKGSVGLSSGENKKMATPTDDDAVKETEGNRSDAAKKPQVKKRKATKKKAAKKKAVSKKAVKKRKQPKIDRDALRAASTMDGSGKNKRSDLPDDEGWAQDVVDESGSAADAERAPDFVDGLGTLFGGVKSISTSALKIARGRTLDSAARMIQRSPDQLEKMVKAGQSLQDLRQVTGASLEEVAGAIDLNNPDLLQAVEEGRAALPFEILLRLSSFYARNNPVPFILNYARTYNPLVAKTLEKIGLDKLVIEAEREIQFVQILRSRDAARELSDEDFKRVHAFTEKAFDMALNFAAGEDDEQ